MHTSLAILVSGRGSNMAAILNAIQDGRLHAKVAVVASNNPDAQALATARKFGVPVVSVSHKGLTRQEHEEKLLQALENFQIDYVVLAGYMRVLTSKFLDRFRNQDGHCRIINIHPSLLPAFPGANAYEEAFAYGVKVSGITVHLVDEKVDHGPILAQETFPRLDSDTLDTFKTRGLQVEHKLYVEVLESITNAGLTIVPGAREQEKRDLVKETKH